MSLPTAKNTKLESCLQDLVTKIKNAKSILLTTHKQCDGDGLGAQIALYFALKKMNKNVRVFCVDEVPRKYHFLNFQSYLEVYNKAHSPLENIDLSMIFDTNDSRLVEPLYSKLKEHSNEIFFVDHHPVLEQGPIPTTGSYIDTESASTGEIAYYIIKGLGVELDKDIARALYTSIAFDTQVFRFIRNSSRSHLIAADLLQFEKEPESIHKNLFAAQTKGKMKLLAKAFSSTDFYGDNEEIAFLKITSKDLTDNNLEIDDSRDVLDMIMSISSIEVGALLQQVDESGFKLSLRSRGKYRIVKVAENLGGGGHSFAAGAYIEGDMETVVEKCLQQIKKIID